MKISRRDMEEKYVIQVLLIIEIILKKRFKLQLPKRFLIFDLPVEKKCQLFKKRNIDNFYIEKRKF